MYADLELVVFRLGLECLPKRTVANVQLALQELVVEGSERQQVMRCVTGRYILA